MAVRFRRAPRLPVAVSLLFIIVLLILLFTSSNLQRPAPIAKNEEFTSILSKVNSNVNGKKITGARKEFSVNSGAGGDFAWESPPIGVDAAKLERQGLFPYDDLSPAPSLGQRGPFWVFYNFLTAKLRFTRDQSVTYATNADHTFLHNLVPLVENWRGLVSLSVYTPGTDYYETLLRIQYLRECEPLVRDFVSFHLFFANTQIPQNLRSSGDEALSRLPMVNCSIIPSFGPNVTTFRKDRELYYPVNVGRNVAREMASTHYVLVSDIELYPSPNLIPNFLEMIQRDGRKVMMKSPKPKVFVLPQFEVEANVSALPYDKIELQDMLSKGIAVPFRTKLCPLCFTLPRQEEWTRAEVMEGLHVFTVAKRQGPQHFWEPTYIGTKSDPMFDERLSWEGWEDKTVQAYILCLLDYEFHILDNAFLVHWPGIRKVRRHSEAKWTVVRQQHQMILKYIEPELTLLYGRRRGCQMSSRKDGKL